MSVLHVCCNYATSSVFKDLFSRMAGQGLAQRVYVPEKEEARMGKFATQAYPVVYSRIVRPWDRFFYYTKARRSVPDLRAKVDLSDVTLVHAHTLFTDGGIAYRLGLPYVVSVRFTDIEYFYKYMKHLRRHAQKILLRAQGIVFLSAVSRDKVLRHFIDAAVREEIAKKCVVIPNGIDEAWLDGEARTLSGGALTIGFCGKLEARKQPLQALRAARRVQEMTGRDVCFLVAGEGPLRQALEKEGQGMLDYLGQLSGITALKEFYRRCDVLLVPSKAETFGLCYLEAMSQGVPVLYTRGQGFDGQFPEGEVGYGVQAGDEADMAAQVCACLEGYAARSARCISGAKALEWNGVAARMLAFYQGVRA